MNQVPPTRPTATRRSMMLASAGAGVALLPLGDGAIGAAVDESVGDPRHLDDGRSVPGRTMLEVNRKGTVVTDLADHRVARIAFHDLVSRYPRTVGRNSHLGSHGSGPTSPIGLVQTDQGAVGWGLLRGAPDGLDAIVGRRLSDLFDPSVGVVDPAAEPLDFALHDLAGVILGQPVYRMIGENADPIVPCYDGAIYFDDLDPEEAPRGVAAVLQNCVDDHALGYRAFKLKIGRGYRWMSPADGLRRDIEVTRAVSGAFPDAAILVDANDGYDIDGFVSYLDGIGDVRLFWIEEPFAEHRDDLARLREALNRRAHTTLIADGELRPSIPFLLDLAANRLVDVLLMDIASLGLTGWRRLMPDLVRIGALASPHAWGVPLKTLYAAHLAAGVGNVVTVEAVPGTSEGVNTDGYRVEDGFLHLPDLPGFGIEPPAVATARLERTGPLGR